MRTDPDPEELSPRELALLACYQDGTLAPDDRLEAERLLARSEAARETIAESSALLDPEPGDHAPPGGFEPPAATQASTPADRAPSPQMGWRTFLPLAAAGVLGILLFWPGREPLNLVSWSDSLVRQGGGERFTFPVVRSRDLDEGLEETAGVRWVGLRIALHARRSTQADSLARELSASLATMTGSGSTRARIDALVDRSPAPKFEEIEAIQRDLVDLLGHDFEEAAILETLRRAASVSAADLAAELVEHPHLNDGTGEDLHPDMHSRLLALCQNGLTAGELTEMESIVTEILRQRT